MLMQELRGGDGVSFINCKRDGDVSKWAIIKTNSRKSLPARIQRRTVLHVPTHNDETCTTVVI